LASRVVEGDHPDIEHRVAALREVAEETGIALTVGGASSSPEGRGIALFEALDRATITLDGRSLTLVSRWVTPAYAPQRYDTRFYLARGDRSLPVRIDSDELEAAFWVTPTEALRRHDRGEWEMFLPTLAHLRWLSRRADVDDAVSSARGADGRSLIQPRAMEDGSTVPIHIPVEA
jgi:8-oxo-dGTP pyrophosphatase MutT (NUDIX family)